MSNDLFGSNSHEAEIENDFLVHFGRAEAEEANDRALTRLAQTAVSQDEAAAADNALATTEDATPEAPAGGPQDAAGETLPPMDTDTDEMEAIKTLLPWDSFSIDFDPHYSKFLEEQTGLPPMKAKAKSFYIYFAPENKRLEGVVNKRYIGGYGTKEELGEDFAFIKTLSPEGFSPEWKEKLLTDIDELSAVENPAVVDKLREKTKEKTENPENNSEELGKEIDKENTVQFPQKSQEVAPPQPVGKVNTNELPLAAKEKSMVMRRMSRIKAFKSA